jgi:large subunit ribosomal protein L6
MGSEEGMSGLMVTGAVGKMSMTIPNFINLEHDEPNRKAFVSVQDKEVKKQREMWGMLLFTKWKVD